MSPSVSENRSPGKRGQNSAQSRSTKVKIDIVDDEFIFTLAGASAAAGAERDDDPTWQHRTVPESHAAEKSGSHSPEWIDGMFSASGFSENVTAWHPLSASRRTSAAAFSTSNSGRMPQGMNRPGCDPHHSSTCQSL